MLLFILKTKLKPTFVQYIVHINTIASIKFVRMSFNWIQNVLENIVLYCESHNAGAKKKTRIQHVWIICWLLFRSLFTNLNANCAVIVIIYADTIQQREMLYSHHWPQSKNVTNFMWYLRILNDQIVNICDSKWNASKLNASTGIHSAYTLLRRRHLLMASNLSSDVNAYICVNLFILTVSPQMYNIWFIIKA